MMKHIYILTVLLLCCACEAPLDLNCIDSSPCIMANTLIGNAEPSRIYVKTAVPMNSGDKSLGEKRVYLHGEVAGRKMEFKDISMNFGQGAYEYTPEISPGERIRIEASAAGVPEVYAETTVPQPMDLKSACILERKKASSPSRSLMKRRKMDTTESYSMTRTYQKPLVSRCLKVMTWLCRIRLWTGKF